MLEALEDRAVPAVTAAYAGEGNDVVHVSTNLDLVEGGGDQALVDAIDEPTGPFPVRVWVGS